MLYKGGTGLGDGAAPLVEKSRTMTVFKDEDELESVQNPSKLSVMNEDEHELEMAPMVAVAEERQRKFTVIADEGAEQQGRRKDTFM